MRSRISTCLFLGIAVLTVLRALLDWAWAADLAGLAAVLFLVLEFQAIPKLQKNVGAAILVAGLAAAVAGPTPLETVRLALHKALPFLLLFASVAWLQVPSGQSPALLTVRENVLRQPPGRRFAWVAGVGHFLGVAFNLAGLSLLTPMVAPGTEPRLQRRLSRAMVQGFGAGTSWSPLYVGTAVIIASVPGVQWAAVGPVGFAIAMGLLLYFWAADRVLSRPRSGEARPVVREPPKPVPAGIWFRVAAILGALFGCIIGLVEGLGWSIPVSLAVTAPPFAALWSFLIGAVGVPGAGPGATARTVLAGLPGLRGEALLFTGANLLGVSVAALIPDAGPGGLPVAPWAVLIAIMVGYGLASAVGLHPVVTVVLVTSLLPPETVGVPPEVLALALMVMWGQGTNVSPFSATVLFMARATGQSGWTVAWRWNGPFVIGSTILLCAVIVGLYASGLYG